MRKITAYDKSSVKLFLAQEEAACNLINLQCSDRVKKKKKKKKKNQASLLLWLLYTAQLHVT